MGLHKRCRIAFFSALNDKDEVNTQRKADTVEKSSKIPYFLNNRINFVVITVPLFYAKDLNRKDDDDERSYFMPKGKLIS